VAVDSRVARAGLTGNDAGYRPVKEFPPMKRLVLVSVALLVVAAGCDRKDRFPTSPRANKAHTGKAGPALTSVCASYRRKLVVMDASMRKNPKDATLGAKASALHQIVADACN
jgi:hypothetical protein